MIQQGISHSIVRRAQESGAADIRVVDLRQYTHDRHRTTDDTPCGGGGGMIMKVEPVAEALDDLVGGDPKVRVLLTDPQGRQFDQAFARELAEEEHIVILCGHYEGVDERIRQHLVTDEVSIGDYVLTGGELPALIILDAITRLQSGALGDEGAPDRDSFADGLLEAVKAGATAVIQPGGSIRDEEVIKAADDNNIAMIFTGIRHFKH